MVLPAARDDHGMVDVGMQQKQKTRSGLRVVDMAPKLFSVEAAKTGASGDRHEWIFLETVMRWGPGFV